MSDSIYARENVIQFPVRRALKRDARRQTQYDVLIDQLQAAHSREKVWLREKSDLLQRHVTLSQEFEHRLANSLQMIVSVLSLQSRTASPEAAAQLTVAANRIASFARVHRRLHVLDHQASVNSNDISSSCAKTCPGCCLRGKPRSRSRLWRLIYPLRSLSRSHLSSTS